MIIVFDCLPVSDLLAKYAHYDSGHWGSSPFRQEKSHLPDFMELNSLLRTILYAGKTELAVTGRLHSSRRQLIVAARTNVSTNATVNTSIGHGKDTSRFSSGSPPRGRVHSAA